MVGGLSTAAAGRALAVRVTRFARLLIVLTALTLPSGLLAGPASATSSARSSASSIPAHLVRVRVDGRDRNGHLVTQLPAVFLRWTGESYQSYGPAISVLPGGYLVGAQVPTGTASETLVVRHLTIRKSGTIMMSARHGRLVKVVLTGVHAVPSGEEIAACLRNSGNDVIPAVAGGSGMKIYAVPFRSASVGFSYQASWLAAGGVGYNLTGASNRGIPARLSFRQAASHLARLAITVRDRVNPATSILWGLTPGNAFQSLCSYGQTGGQPTEPFSTIQYVTPGLWTTRVDTIFRVDDVGFNYLVRHLAARHRYFQTFGAAVAGPGRNFPDVNGNTIRYNASDLFDLPGIPLGGDQCCARSVVVVRFGGRVVARAKVDEWRGRTYFQKVVTKAGWYTLNVTANRRNPHGPEPADMLSTRATLSWRFHVTPVPPTGYPHEIPVTVTTFVPLGLSMDNQAKPGTITTVRLRLIRAGISGDPAARYAIKSVRALASIDGGKSWRPLKVLRHRGFWLTTVHDPASGYVSLRSIVTDTHGDRTVQTIYRAYAVG